MIESLLWMIFTLRNTWEQLDIIFYSFFLFVFLYYIEQVHTRYKYAQTKSDINAYALQWTGKLLNSARQPHACIYQELVESIGKYYCKVCVHMENERYIICIACMEKCRVAYVYHLPHCMHAYHSCYCGNKLMYTSDCKNMCVNSLLGKISNRFTCECFKILWIGYFWVNQKFRKN